MSDLPIYRAFQLNDSGHIVGAIVIDVATDEEALLQARLLAQNGPIELWERSRLLGRLPPEQPGEICLSSQ